MITRRSFTRAAGAAAFALPAASRLTWAQSGDWPAREIHAICMFAPGTSADVFTRHVGKQMQDTFGKPVVVENKVGAFGNIATEYVAKARPDGYTIYIAPGSSVFAASPHLFKKLPFDPANDFEHITTVARLPFLLLVSGDSPYKTVADLVSDLKQKGEKASYGSVANTGLVGSELFKAQFGLQTVEVKYRDPFTLMQDIWGGNLAFFHLDAATVDAHLKSGKLRALSTTSQERAKATPDIPSARETGIANSDMYAWWSVHVPKGTPKPILDKLEAWFNSFVASEAGQKFMTEFKWDPFPGNSTMLKELLAKETKVWAEYVRLARIQPQ
jgi:tripartite-type tricarboxylate transporter receptor subunit TctC